MERVDHEDSADLIVVASTENTGVQGTDTSTHEHPTIANSSSAFIIASIRKYGDVFTYGPSSPARDSVSLRASEAMLAEKGDGAVSLCFPSVS